MEQTPTPPEHQQVHWRIPAAVHTALTEFAGRTNNSGNAAAVRLLGLGLTVAEPRPTSWGAAADARWDVFRAAVQRGLDADQAADLAGIERLS